MSIDAIEGKTLRTLMTDKIVIICIFIYLVNANIQISKYPNHSDIQIFTSFRYLNLYFTQIFKYPNMRYLKLHVLDV